MRALLKDSISEGGIPQTHQHHLAFCTRVMHGRGRVVREYAIGGRLPTYRFITRNSATMVAWFVVIE